MKRIVMFGDGIPTANPLDEIMKEVFKNHGITLDTDKHELHIKPVPGPFEIQSVLSNRKKNAFTVVWADGTHTTVHCQAGDEWDDEKALAMCFTKKALGNKGNFNDKFNDALDNKMKVIPEEKKVIPAKFVHAKEVCNCDDTCIECKCEKEKVSELTEAIEKMKKSANIAAGSFDINTQTATELGKAANKASNSLKEMIDALTGETTPKTGKIEKTPLYRVFIRISGKSHHDSDFTSIDALRARVHEITEELYGRKPYYYRTWMNGDRMMIDFGHYTQFIEVEGITPDEYAKN